MEFNNKRFILYGDNKLKEDFEYVFEGLHIEKVINENNYKNVLNEDLNNIIILICDKNLNEVINKFQNIGLTYKKHFFIARDFFYDLVVKFPDLKDKKVVIWGTGNASKLLISLIDFDFEYYIDNDINKNGEIINGKRVEYSKNIYNWNDKFIIVATGYGYYDEIKENLLSMGLEENKDFIHYKQFTIFKEMFDKLAYTTEVKKIKCNMPFEYCNVSLNGNIDICCFTSLYPIGNIKLDNMENIWNSVYAKMVRRSIINKTFCYCDSKCHLWSIGMFSENKLSKYPLNVSIEMDDTWNLMCTQCRNEMIIAKGHKYKDMDYIADRIIDNVIPHIKLLQLASNGEVFFSPAYKKILKSNEMKNLESLSILSNGILFNRENWEIIKNHNIKDIDLHFSIDAATKETYEKLRKGGNFDTLIKNLKFAGELRKNNEIRYYVLFFVVQKENYKEMIKFIELGESVNADFVSFTRIRNCSGYSEKEFEEISMYDKNDKPKPELQKILSNPIFKSSKVKLSLDLIE